MILLGTALLLLNKKLATRAISAGHLASWLGKESCFVRWTSFFFLIIYAGRPCRLKQGSRQSWSETTQQ